MNTQSEVLRIDCMVSTSSDVSREMSPTGLNAIGVPSSVMMISMETSVAGSRLARACTMSSESIV